MDVTLVGRGGGGVVSQTVKDMTHCEGSATQSKYMYRVVIYWTVFFFKPAAVTARPALIVTNSASVTVEVVYRSWVEISTKSERIYIF